MASEIVQKYIRLAVARDGDGLTGLHFLANISTAFPSGSRLGVLRRFIYNCMHSHLSSFLCLLRTNVNVCVHTHVDEQVLLHVLGMSTLNDLSYVGSHGLIATTNGLMRY